MTAPLLWQVAPHAGYFINSVGTSDDGRTLVAGTFFHSYSEERRAGANSNDGTFGIYCFDPATGATRWSNTFDGYEGVYWATVSSDGSYAASCGWYSSTPTYNGFIAAFDAATGGSALDYYKTPSRVNQVSLNADGSVLAAGGDQLYLFFRSGTQFSTTPSTLPVASGDSVISIGISADGQWVAAGTYDGTVLLVKIVGGVPVSSNKWAPATTNTVHSVAMAKNGQGFAVGMKNGEFVYFDCEDFIGTATPVPAWTQTLTGASSVYGVAIASDASFVSAVGNIGSAGGTAAVYDNSGTAATLRWQQSLTANPNSTSIDSEGLFVAVADGHPDGTPGHFTLFNAASSAQIWSYTTGNMSWPIQLAGNAMACIAGSDDGNVYYFNPLRVF
ncbi:MAG: WD40 repeat domain-containing protein [Lysobacteraceae bacterium]